MKEEILFQWFFSIFLDLDIHLAEADRCFSNLLPGLPLFQGSNLWPCLNLNRNANLFLTVTLKTYDPKVDFWQKSQATMIHFLPFSISLIVTLTHICPFSCAFQVPDPCCFSLKYSLKCTHIRKGDINISLYGCNAIWVSASELQAALNPSDFREFKKTCEETDGFDNCTTSECRSHMLIKFVSLVEKTYSEISPFVTFRAVVMPKRTQSPWPCLNHPHANWN